MENATKALLIAAAVLLAIMVISLLVTMYNQIASKYQQEQELIAIDQLEQFNRQFENYNRDSLRGNELISFMNKIIDYNASQSYEVDTGYERIRVTIDLKGLVDEFKYELDSSRYGNRNALIIDSITNTTGGGNNYANDKKLIAITGTSSQLINEAKGIGFDDITDTQLQQLQSKISSVIIDENSETDRAILNRYYRANILEDLLGWDDLKDNLDDTTWKSQSADISDKIEGIKNITNQYYQYTQFKRALFDCTDVEYDSETNRIVRMDFEVQSESVNGVETVVFD